MRAGRPRSQGMCIAAWCAMRMTVSCEHRGTRFPHTPARRRGWAGYALTQGEGEPGFPHVPARRRGWASYALTQGEGEPGFPHVPARRRGWAGYALTQGEGETGFPNTLPAGGLCSPRAGRW